MPTTTNFGWTTPADTDLVKDGALAIRTLGNGIDTSLVDLKGGTTGQVLSKASNTDMDFTWVAQDDSNAIQNAIIDAKGDLIVGTAADTPARLAVGTNGHVLTADSTAASGVKWAAAASGTTFAGCVLGNNTNITVPSGTETTLTWANEAYDTDGYHSTSSNTSRITIPSGKAGYYLFIFRGDWGTVNASDERIARLYKNGSYARQDKVVNPGSSREPQTTLKCIMYGAVGDYFEIRALQGSGSSNSISGNWVSADNLGSSFECSYLGA